MVSKPSCIKSVIETLGAYLKLNIPQLNQVIYQFPDPNTQLKYPSVSILAGNPQFTPVMPAEELDLGVISVHKAIVQRIIGQYDFILQLDIWCRDKVERFTIYEEIFNLFNTQSSNCGISLRMTNYYNIYCRYDLDNIVMDDSEISSQKSEWRIKLNILANTRAVSEKSEYIIETIQNNLTTPNSIANE